MKSTKLIYLSIICLCFSFKSQGQDYRKQQNEIFAYNIVSNGLISGISGCFNKKKGQKLLPVFFRNFSKGCLGGLVKYTSKSQTYYLRNASNTYFAPFNRAFYFLGHSISMNASLNEKRLLENYYCNFYGFDFMYSPYKNQGEKFKTRLSLGTLASVIYFSASGHKLDIYKTLEYGQFYYDLKPNAMLDGLKLHGLAGYNVFAIKKFDNGISSQSVVPHEVIHTYQYYDFFALSSSYKVNLEQKLNQNKYYKFASRYISFDYEPLFFSALYGIQPKPRYYRNFFEYEAEHFSSRQFINR